MQNYLEGLVRTLDCERVRAGAVGLLADIGMAVPSETVRKRLAAAGMEIREGRVFIAAERTEAFIERQRSEAPSEPVDAPTRLHPGSHCFYHFDPEDQRIKSLTMRDLERYTKLIAALQRDGVLASAYCPGVPADVDPRLAPLWQQFVGARFVPQPPIYAYSPVYAPFSADGAQGATGEASVRGCPSERAQGGARKASAPLFRAADKPTRPGR